MNYRSIATVLFLAFYSTYNANADEKNTAKFVVANKAELAGENARLHVTHVTPLDPEKAPSGLTFLLAHTYDEKEHVRGGAIMVMATAAEAERLKTKFGVTPRVFGRHEKKAITKTLKGKVGVHVKGRRPYVIASEEAEAIVNSKS